MADNINNGRRRLLTTVTTSVGLVGAGALAVPLVASMKPSARARAAGAPVEVDITDLAPVSDELKIDFEGIVQEFCLVPKSELSMKQLKPIRS